MSRAANHTGDNALKLAFADLLAACGGSTNAASPNCRVGQQSLSDYANLSKPESFPPADVIGDLETRSATHPDHPIMTRALARRQHFALVPLPRANLSESTVLPYAGRLAKDVGHLEVRIGEALTTEESPGIVSPEEVEAMELMELSQAVIRRAVEICEFLRRRKEGDL